MKKVWINKEREMNKEYVFCGEINNKSKETTLKIACSNAYQIYINGKFFAYGPLRSAHNYSNIAVYTLSELGKLNITVLAVEYAINSYYIVDEKAFISLEIFSNGEELSNIDNFKAYDFNERIQKVERLCLQRNFVEAYNIDDDFNKLFFSPSRAELKKVEVSGNTLLNSELTLPTYEKLSFNKIIESGEIYRQKFGEYYQYSAPPSGVIRDVCKGFTYDELETRVSDEVCSFGYKVKNLETQNTLNNEYALYDLGVNKSGFIQIEVEVKSSAVNLYLAFDEILYDEVNVDEELSQFYKGEEKKLIFHRLCMVNAVKYSLKNGKYTLTTFEPYTLRYLKIIAENGAVTIGNAEYILYENPDSYKLLFSCEDKKLQAVMNSAQNTFAQNAVDVLTDCPSRERAGWLCDSFFSARAEKLLTGDNKVERNFLNNYLIMPKIEAIPYEIPPMCYPSDHLNGTYIPNWSFWLVIELYDYLERTGDINFTIKFKQKINVMLNYFIENFSNSDGLLEKLDKWVFIEWSKANELTQDVNYPTNMLFYAALKCGYKMFGEESYNILAERIKLKIIEQSYNGEFFEDNRVRINGELVRTKEKSETCQYYAMFFKVADYEHFGDLYQKMFASFGAKRVETVVYPDIYKSNAFIGNFLRLELIRQSGNNQKVLEECIDYLYYQSERTGTLWENVSPSVSCNHGFTSYVACVIVEALSGYACDNNGEPIFNDNYAKINSEIVLPIKNNFYKITVKNGTRSVIKI